MYLSCLGPRLGENTRARDCAVAYPGDSSLLYHSSLQATNFLPVARTCTYPIASRRILQLFISRHIPQVQPDPATDHGNKEKYSAPEPGYLRGPTTGQYCQQETKSSCKRKSALKTGVATSANAKDGKQTPRAHTVSSEYTLSSLTPELLHTVLDNVSNDLSYTSSTDVSSA